MEATDSMLDLDEVIDMLEGVQNWALYESELPTQKAQNIDIELSGAMNCVRAAMRLIEPIADAEREAINRLDDKADRASL